jgi:hypothetical protein
MEIGRLYGTSQGVADGAKTKLVEEARLPFFSLAFWDGVPMSP